MINLKQDLQINKTISELFLYFIYIYLCVILALIFKPTLIPLLIIGIYCFYTTWIIFTNSNSQSYLLKNEYLRFAIVFNYSLFCMLTYYILHTYWKKLIKFPLFKILIICSPIIYFSLIKLIGYIFTCDSHYCINFILRNPFYHVLEVIDLIKNTLVY